MRSASWQLHPPHPRLPFKVGPQQLDAVDILGGLGFFGSGHIDIIFFYHFWSWLSLLILFLFFGFLNLDISNFIVVGLLKFVEHLEATL